MSERVVTADPVDEPLTFLSQGGLATINGNPREQMIFSFVAGVAASIPSVLLGPLSFVLIWTFAVTFSIGLVRYIFDWLMVRRWFM